MLAKRREKKQGKCYKHLISQPRESSQATIMGGRENPESGGLIKLRIQNLDFRQLKVATVCK